MIIILLFTYMFTFYEPPAPHTIIIIPLTHVLDYKYPLLEKQCHWI